MIDKTDYMDKFVDRLGKELVKDIKEEILDRIKTTLEQRFKGMRASLEPIDRMEQEHKAIGRDIESLTIAVNQIQQDLKELKINSDGLPKEVEQAVKESSSQLAGAIAKDVRELGIKKKPMFLLRFWKRGKK